MATRPTKLTAARLTPAATLASVAALDGPAMMQLAGSPQAVVDLLSELERTIRPRIDAEVSVATQARVLGVPFQSAATREIGAARAALGRQRPLEALARMHRLADALLRAGLAMDAEVASRVVAPGADRFSMRGAQHG